MIRTMLKPASNALRSLLGTNGLSGRMSHLQLGIQQMDARGQTDLQQVRQSIEQLAVLMTPLQPEHAFLETILPSGARYFVSYQVRDQDDFHAAVSVGAVHDSSWIFLNAWVRPGDVFFDLGANIGTISLPACINGAQVHAFELLSSNIQHLSRSVSKNGISELTIIQGAVSDRPGFAGVGGTSAWGGVVPQSRLYAPHIVIDDYVDHMNIRRVDVMKIDIEGSEKAALSGADRTLARWHPDIVFEANAMTCGNAGYSYRVLLDILRDHGYAIYRILDRKLCPPADPSPQEAVNVDYFASTKSEAEIKQRSGWQISMMSDDEIVGSVETQDLHGDLYKQYVLAVEKRLPSAVRDHPSVARLIEQWRELEQADVRRVLEAGAA